MKTEKEFVFELSVTDPSFAEQLFQSGMKELKEKEVRPVYLISPLGYIHIREIEISNRGRISETYQEVKCDTHGNKTYSKLR